MIDSPEIFRLIETATLFRGIQRETLESLFRKAKLVTLKQGEKLLSPGVINEQVYIVLSGRLSVQITPSTSAEPIAMLAPGECVGEMSVLVDGLVSAYVIAATNCELFAIDYTSFWALIDGSNEAARNMLNILVHRIRLGNAVMADSLLHHERFPDDDIIDNTTGLYNYHGMHRKFDRLLHRCVVGNQPLCIAVLEVDDDARGGMEEMRVDQSLHTIAQAMLTLLRPDDHAARLIGKKFAVLLANISLVDAFAAADRLRVTISQTPIPMPNGKALPPVTISAGVCEALPSDTWGTLVARADIALEQAKGEGRNRVARV
ncbi:MAG: GGDEF domain-containing protein [Nitrosomonadales bacterium]|nr:GGDEF domain-containing protein [Nitrosomonadales bacterium]